MRASNVIFGVALAVLAIVFLVRVRADRAPGIDELEWPLGPPDLIVRLPAPAVIPPHDEDAFRNLVLTPGLTDSRFVQAVHIRPGQAGVVHHAVVKLDPTGDSRRRALATPGPGFEGMDMGLSIPPPGHFLVWTPGMEPALGSAARAWPLGAGTDLVLQLHLPARDTAVVVEPAIGLYFAAHGPTEILEQVFLNSVAIDIPPGDSDYVVTDAMALPVDVEVLRAFPHAHYLARTMLVTAEHPGGRLDSLLVIEDWDFGRQLDYALDPPVTLPAGTRVAMRYRYDNSAANPQNPSDPPRRVRLGMASTDEMASLRLQVRLGSESDRLRLTEAQTRHAMEDAPDNPELNYELGTSLLHQGRLEEALEYLRRATEQRPAFPWAWNNLGVALAQSGDLAGAIEAWQQVLALEPDHLEVYNNLGNAFLERGNASAAVGQFRAAILRAPENPVLHRNLAIALTRLGDLPGAVEALEEAVRLAPEHGAWNEELVALRRAAADGG